MRMVNHSSRPRHATGPSASFSHRPNEALTHGSPKSDAQMLATEVSHHLLRETRFVNPNRIKRRNCQLCPADHIAWSMIEGHSGWGESVCDRMSFRQPPTFLDIKRVQYRSTGFDERNSSARVALTSRGEDNGCRRYHSVDGNTRDRASVVGLIQCRPRIQDGVALPCGNEPAN